MNEEYIQDFLKHYVMCALWSSTGNDDQPLDKAHTASDISTATMLEIVDDDDSSNYFHKQVHATKPVVVSVDTTHDELDAMMSEFAMS